MTKSIAVSEGRNETAAPFLSVYRRSIENPLTCGIITPSLCLVVNGAKRLHMGTDIFDYTPGDFLVSMIDIPVSGQVASATEASPYIGLNIDFTIDEIVSIAIESKSGLQTDRKPLVVGAFVGKSDIAILKIFIRLLKLNSRPKQAAFLSTLYKQELIYELLSGEYGHLFFKYIMIDQQANGIGNAIVWIKENLSTSFTIESLAKANGMSVSALQHGFKTVTTMGPLKYQKQLRLQEARRLMLNNSFDATTAALKVGYESPSQFSREYRRLFGLPPLQDIKALRNNA
ncbi:AraC family transcriptional regulator [Sedimentibacter hydroxybenzoicus DSM 7310]|uniref:AraC family transcriptional regulator n=2 Tax=Sedimentibacter hydroxybenzoicus TaxID=29345 RepID=A0A974BIE7_SEDHY|nr:AraC family transcriptional regulator [Sedimentibacter hydroxybenzoicus DSM 7310]